MTAWREDTGSRTEQDAGRHEWAHRDKRELPDNEPTEGSKTSDKSAAELMAELVALGAGWTHSELLREWQERQAAR